jgi:DNA-binding transcriptional MerR regulator
MDEIMLTAEVARFLGKSAGMVRVYERTGQLPALRTRGGVRLFRREDVVRLAKILAAKEVRGYAAVSAGVPDDAA